MSAIADNRNSEILADDFITPEEPHGEALSPLAVVRHGIGLMTDLYDLTILNCIRPELEAEYGKMDDSTNGAVTAATTAGAIVGQLVFGYFADRIGRRRTFIATASLLCISCAGCALAFAVGPLSIYQVLIFWRFWLGVGVGGEYPLSAAVSAEHAQAGKSGTNMALTYSMFCIGQLLSPSVVLVLLYSGASDNVTWRLGIGVGAILAFTGAVLRSSTMHESKAWAAAQKRKPVQICSRTTLRAIGHPLLGTMLTYFLYDVVSWGVGGYTSDIFESDSRTGTIWFIQLVNVMAVPGFILVLFMSRFGRKNYQIIGFLGMCCCFVAVGAVTEKAATIVLVLIFGCQKIFDSFGPGATTYIIPGEIFPSEIRATCHGLSAAAGKTGAFVGLYGFPAVKTAVGSQGVFFIGAALLALGALATCILTPPYTEETLIKLRVATEKDISCTTAVLWNRYDSGDGTPLA